MKRLTLIAGGPAIVVALAAAPRPVAAQSLMVGADGAIHLDQFQQVQANNPVIITQTPELIQPSIVQPGVLGQPAGPMFQAPMLGAAQPYGACNVPFVPCMPMDASMIEQPLPIKYSVFGEALYLHPTGVDVAHAQQVSGPGNAVTSPFGEVGVADFDYELGFRAGGDMALSPTTSIAVSYTWFESDAGSRLSPPASAAAFNGVESLVHHPDFTPSVTDQPIDARASLDFQLADGEYRARLQQGPRHWINGGLGLRYARLEQDFNQTGTFLLDTIDTGANADFDGGGPKLALDGGRSLGNRGFSLYARTAVSPLAGEFKSNYSMFSAALDETVIQVDWDDDRIMTIFDYELGLAWTSPRRRWRFAAGYTQSFWFNAVTPAEFIEAVQASNYTDVSDTIMLDGLVARVEHLW